MAYRSLGAFFNYDYGFLDNAAKLLRAWRVQQFSDMRWRWRARFTFVG